MAQVEVLSRPVLYEWGVTAVRAFLHAEREYQDHLAAIGSPRMPLRSLIHPPLLHSLPRFLHHLGMDTFDETAPVELSDDECS